MPVNQRTKSDILSPSATGRALVGLRRRADVACVVCGTSFRSYPNALTCSEQCRSRRRYQRRLARLAGGAS